MNAVTHPHRRLADLCSSIELDTIPFRHPKATTYYEIDHYSGPSSYFRPVCGHLAWIFRGVLSLCVELGDQVEKSIGGSVAIFERRVCGRPGQIWLLRRPAQ